mmetsp:Transcript_20353/g.40003  ORF Transcript_20353/g.40003 Transcript_20353/m.40003 type:complete len:393 (-) Transcript_20353:1319-2497(-)
MQNVEVLQALFGYEILPCSASSYSVEVHIYILWDPRLSFCTEWIKRNGWGHVLFIFGGHGNKNGEILLKDGSVHPRDLFNPWLSGVVDAKVSLILNCCYGFLVAENISEEQEPLFNSVLSYSRLFPDIKDALQVQRDLLAAGMPQSWLSPRAIEAVIKTALFFGSWDFLARSIVQVQSTKNSNIILRINPVALGPISSAGWLPEILQSRFEFAKVKCENEKQDKFIQIWTELVQKKMPSAEVRAQYLKRNLFDFCPETYFTNLKSRLQRFETQEKVRFNANEVMVHQFQANHGESTLVRIIGRVNILIDGGYFNSGETPSFSNVVLDLKDNGQDVDLVILTHGDDDHWSGLPCLFKDAPPKKNLCFCYPHRTVVIQVILKARAYGHLAIPSA